MKYKPTIGLEIHIELKTKTKMFCGCLNDPDEKHPNINICPICLAHPGALPLANKEAIRNVLKLGMALNGKIAKISKFDRKNYFYPDLPKGYQISQFDLPFIEGAELIIPLPLEKGEKYPKTKKIRITRVHLEEDTGRLAHSDDKKFSFVDFNRAGRPLAELVTEPDIENGYQAKTFAEEFQRICRYLDISTANMEKGEMRCEVNISIAEEGSKKLGTKVEIKNLNSFKAVGDSIDFEIKRQSDILDKGEEVIQETRGWDENKKLTFSQRIKEDAHDYRYFPEPDLPVIEVEKLFDLEKISLEVPELIADKRKRFMDEFELDFEQAFLLSDDLELSDYFEKVSSEMDSENKKVAYNYLVGDLRAMMIKNSWGIGDLRFGAEDFAYLIDLVNDNKISSAGFKIALSEMFDTGANPDIIISERKLLQVSDNNSLSEFIKKAIDENPSAVSDFKSGKENALQFLVGKVMALSKGSANPQFLRDKIRDEIGG